MTAITTDTLTKLYVEITTTCNLDCVMCMRRAWNEPLGTMPLDLFRELMTQLAAFDQPPVIHLGGIGEPMHHPEFLDIVAAAKESGARVEMTTNGMLLTEEMASAVYDLGMDRIMVSIDGVTQSSYEDIRTFSSFGQVIENFRNLRRIKVRRSSKHSNPQVGIAFVAMKRNIADLPELPWLATRIGAYEVVVSNLVPHTSEMEAEILYTNSLTDCAYRASPQVADLSLPKMDLNQHTVMPLQEAFSTTASISLLDASLSARNDYCAFAQEGYAAVRWDGMVSPCLPLLHDHPQYIRGRRKEVTHKSMGNINDQPFAELWYGDEYHAFREKLRRFPYSPCSTCGGCERFAGNIIDCTENAFPACGGCLWSQGFVQCP